MVGQGGHIELYAYYPARNFFRRLCCRKRKRHTQSWLPEDSRSELDARDYRKRDATNWVTYVGQLDDEGRPHGFGYWKQDVTHGEPLVGYWKHGLYYAILVGLYQKKSEAAYRQA
eukprot:Lankesteria_metandrocarpae@DN5247_c0_g1_i1.p1